ncbi:MAG: hypothetical protein ACJAUC_003371, partial [Planctomycetota bacterium]
VQTTDPPRASAADLWFVPGTVRRAYGLNGIANGLLFVPGTVRNLFAIQ